LRVLLSIEWSRQLWGESVSRELKEKRLIRYPIENLSENQRNFLELGKKYLGFIAEIMINTKFACLNNKKITELFNMKNMSPWELDRRARTALSGTLDLNGISPCEQLAVFGFIRENYDFDEEMMDRIMNKWLIRLSSQRNSGGFKT
jgi:hypothetical protein